MNIVLKPITQAATKRAQSADPNGLRCLIENCPRNQAVQLTHLFKRDAAADERQTGSLEWAWNMQKNTLNLDTRRNVFFLGASMNQLYREKKWALVPEEAILDRYLYEECLFPLPRDDFPELKDETFRYTFLPIQDMEDVYLTRSTVLPSGERTINVYCYPFERLPQITSHVHPCFAILQVGSILENKLDLTTSRALIAKHPILEKITAIYNEWVALLPQNAKDNPTFMPPRLTDDKRDDQTISDSSSQAESVCTPRQRIRLIPIPRNEKSTSPNSTYSSRVVPPCIPVVKPPQRAQPPRKKKLNEHPLTKEGPLRRKPLNSRALRTLENQGADTNKWTAQKISRWAEACNRSSPSKALANKPGCPRRKKR